MSGMEKTLLRTAQNEGHVCPRRGKAQSWRTELYTWAEGTPRVLEVVESSYIEYFISGCHKRHQTYGVYIYKDQWITI